MPQEEKFLLSFKLGPPTSSGFNGPFREGIGGGSSFLCGTGTEKVRFVSDKVGVVLRLLHLSIYFKKPRRSRSTRYMWQVRVSLKWTRISVPLATDDQQKNNRERKGDFTQLIPPTRSVRSRPSEAPM